MDIAYELRTPSGTMAIGCFVAVLVVTAFFISRHQGAKGAIR
jgi:hypothetical protein